MLLKLRKIKFSYIPFIILFNACTDSTPQNIQHKNKKVLPSQSVEDFKGSLAVFWNVDNLFDTLDNNKNYKEYTPNGVKKWTSERYEQKLKAISTIFHNFTNEAPILIGLAGVENRFVVLDLLNQLGYGTKRISIFPSSDPRGLTNALCFDPTKFHKVDDQSISVNYSTSSEFKGREILYVKGLMKDSIALHVYVNHWKSRFGGAEKTKFKRTVAAEALRSHVDSILGVEKEANIIIMGSFNDEPSDQSISKVLASSNSISNKRNELINLCCPQNESPNGTYVFEDEWRMYDQFIVSSSLLKEGNGLKTSEKMKIPQLPAKYTVLNSPLKGVPEPTYYFDNYIGGASSHLPIYIQFISE